MGVVPSSLVWLKKQLAWMFSPYAKTLYLDADTCFCGNYLSRLFSLLDHFDVLTTVDPAGAKGGTLASVPGSFLERNAGFVAFSDSNSSKVLRARWIEIYKLHLQHWRFTKHEQPAFREALWELRESMGLREQVLTQICRATKKAIPACSTQGCWALHTKSCYETNEYHYSTQGTLAEDAGSIQDPAGNNKPKVSAVVLQRLEPVYASFDEIMLDCGTLEKPFRSCWAADGKKELRRRIDEVWKNILPTYIHVPAARKRIYADLGTNEFSSSMQQFLKEYASAAKTQGGGGSSPYPVRFDEVFGWEADPTFLKTFVKPQKTDRRIHVYNQVVGVYDGAVNIFNGCKVSPANDMNSKSFNGIDFSAWVLKHIRYQDYFVVKMDIEGMEYEVLNKMILSKTIFMIDELFVEVHFRQWNHHPCVGVNKTREDAVTLLGRLRSAGIYVHEWF
ncbi:hypothetical protein CYMTET_10546 [Cymbomonas tetramitiformis]|uniref:DUF7870 domain-containing protein n=1 Tax=Cymbomonas tetramitiformis TaxID=36881 RepID=A0AAE0GQH0_9CHLO|nr:hypothetical protein CYMTET_10546 [Cymbomonas tetramitiformis]